MKRLAIVAVIVAVAIIAASLAVVRWRSPALAPPPTEEQLRELVAQRDSLQARFRDVVVANGEKSLVDAPRGDVMIGIPTAFTRSVLEESVTGIFGHTTLTLKNLKVHKEGEVKVKMLVRRKQVGKYVLDVNISKVRGVLEAGPPKVSFQKDRVAVSLPVKLASGSGSADIHLKWDSKGLLANAVCGDTDVTKTVTGGVIPQSYVLNGAFRIASRGDAIVLTPDFKEELAVRIFVDPSEQAWQAVEEVVNDQRRACSAVLDKIDIKEILGGLVGKGFNVKIPKRLIKQVRIPAGVQRSLELQGVHVALRIEPTGFKVASERLWYGANVAVALSGPRVRPPPPVSE